MKHTRTTLKLYQFQLEEQQKRVQQIASMCDDFINQALELEADIRREELHANIFDPEHYAYPIYAKAARVRRQNLLASAKNLLHQLEHQRSELEMRREHFYNLEKRFTVLSAKNETELVQKHMDMYATPLPSCKTG